MSYVVAVSGGVDSIVLLNMLLNPDRRPDNGNWGFLQSNVIVAHFDHGIRSDSSSDEKFVRGVAGEYGLSYETERAELGPQASEETAREMRYNFLRRCCKKYNARLLTAHHQDDLLETMIINLIRGTGWRGLAPMNQILDLRSQILDKPPTTNQELPILRPMLGLCKSELLDYAKTHNLEWREDSTNENTEYLRNHVRLNLIPQMVKKDPDALSKLLAINKTTIKVKKDIATELQIITNHYSLTTTHFSIPRYQLIMLPSSVALEVIYSVLTSLDPSWHPSTLQLKRALHFAKTAGSQKCLEVSKHLELSIKGAQVQFIKC